VQNGELLTAATTSGSETAAPGDSGGGCFVNNQTVGVASYVVPVCDNPTNDVTCGATLTKIVASVWRSPSAYAAYIDQAPLCPAAGTASFRPMATPNLDGTSVLPNGWTNHPFDTNDAGAALIANTIHLRGAVATNGTNEVAFQLPVGLRPSSRVFVPITLCSSAKGRLVIDPIGNVSVGAEDGDWSKAQCFTSLDGASFAVNSVGAQPLTLINGWTASAYETRPVQARNVNGIVRLQGAILGGATAEPFSFPAGL